MVGQGEARLVRTRQSETAMGSAPATPWFSLEHLLPAGTSSLPFPLGEPTQTSQTSLSSPSLDAKAYSRHLWSWPFTDLYYTSSTTCKFFVNINMLEARLKVLWPLPPQSSSCPAPQGSLITTLGPSK